MKKRENIVICKEIDFRKRGWYNIGTNIALIGGNVGDTSQLAQDEKITALKELYVSNKKKGSGNEQTDSLKSAHDTEEIHKLLIDLASKKTKELISTQPIKSSGPCLFVMYDSETGKVAYGQNFKTTLTGYKEYANWLENDADPFIQNRTAKYAEAIQNGDLILQENADKRLAGHSEVGAFDQILKKRREEQ